MGAFRKVAIATVGLVFEFGRFKKDIASAIGLPKLPFMFQLWAYGKLSALPNEHLERMHEGLPALLDKLDEIGALSSLELERLAVSVLEAETRDDLVRAAREFTALCDAYQEQSLEASLSWISQMADAHAEKAAAENLAALEDAEQVAREMGIPIDAIKQNLAAVGLTAN